MIQSLEIVLIVVVCGMVLAFGGVQPWAYTLMEVVIFPALALMLAAQIRKGKLSLPCPFWPLPWFGLVLLQIIPLPSNLVESISPGRTVSPQLVPLWQAGSSGITLSIYPHATLVGLVRVAAYLAAFILASMVFDSQKRKSYLVRALIALGIFEAAYGSIEYLTGWQNILGVRKLYYVESATGTFINHNHFSGFLEMVLPFVLAMIFYTFQLWQSNRSTTAPNPYGFQMVFYFSLLLIILVGIVLSESRAGIFTSILCIMFMTFLAQFKTRKKAWMLINGLFILTVAAYVMWVGLDPVLARFNVLRGGTAYLQQEGRLTFWKDSLAILHSFPIVGSGLGTFAWVFRHYQTNSLTYLVDHPHNDYVEFATDTGFLGALLLFLPILALWVKMVISFLRDPRRYRPAITLGCIGATLALLIHSFADFNLQIPANALTFAIVLGIGYKAAILEPKQEKKSA